MAHRRKKKKVKVSRLKRLSEKAWLELWHDLWPLIKKYKVRIGLVLLLEGAIHVVAVLHWNEVMGIMKGKLVPIVTEFTVPAEAAERQ